MLHFRLELEHYKKGNVILKISKSLIPSCIIGAIIGAYVAKMLSGYFLQIFFGVFECVIGVYFFATAKKMIAEDAPLPKYLVIFIIGLIVSSFSTLVGIGGGVLLVPILSFCNVPIKKAIGTSSSVSLIITFIGAISYLLLGLNVSSVPDGVGFLYLPAFITISIAAFIAAPFWCKTHRSTPHSASQTDLCCRARWESRDCNAFWLRAWRSILQTIVSKGFSICCRFFTKTAQPGSF